MNAEKYCRYVWYQVARSAPTSSLRRRALSNVSFADVSETAYIGPTTTITPFGGETPRETLLTISDRATVSPNVTFLCSIHPERANIPGVEGGRAPIVVGNDVWIGAGAIVMGGVTLGERSIVGAGAVVTSDVETGETVVGVPAKPIEQRKTSG